MRQWMLRITAYADRLVDDLDQVDWPEAIVKMQRDWVGRSEGAQITFEVADSDERIDVFTTRPDTLFGATYMVLAPEHPLVPRLTTPVQREAVDAYVSQTARRSERARLAETHDKSGVFTGGHAIHPVTGDRLPIWIADYVLATYGSGAIMAVPAHDERDWEFAKKFELPIVEVVSGGDVDLQAWTGDGVCVNSGFLDGLESPAAKQRMTEWLAAQGRGEKTVNYKLRDWLFSRQRYWGEPFPVLHLEDGTTALVPEADLPVLLPELEDFRPTGEFEPPLARARDWVETTDPETGRPAVRDANTMPQWAGSCWYFLRFCDPDNTERPWSEEAERYWMPVDLYVGGAEHAVLHLLYSRFWHKVLYDLGLVHTVEPFQKLLNPGMILGYSYRYYEEISAASGAGSAEGPPRAYGSDDVRFVAEAPVHRDSGAALRERWVPSAEVRWVDERPLHPNLELRLEEVTEKMSKSRGNVVSPDAVIDQYGADAMRLYEMFMGPLEKGAPWSDEAIPGLHRFLQRVHRLVAGEDAGDTATGPRLPPGEGTPDQARLLAQTVQGVTDDLEGMRFNTAISKLMVWARDVTRDAPLHVGAAETFVRLLCPFAPHLAEELWRRLGHDTSPALEAWPEADPEMLVKEVVRLAVQVNGKRRDEIDVPADADEESIRNAALASENVQRHLAGRPHRKVIVVPGRLVNVVG
jgi:leucyl-tRNA synthetase